MSGIAAVVLAAGASTRFGTPKQQLLLPRVLARLEPGQFDELLVVEGAHPLPGVSPHLPYRLVHCREWERGTGASLRCGLRELSAGIEAAVVLLVDGPQVSPRAIDRVVKSWREQGGDLVAASYGRERGHPLLVARAAWDEIPDEGLRAIEPRLVPCDDLGAPGDVDTPADLDDLDPE